MEYTITNNPQFNSLEIAFDGIPGAEIRESLKALRFHWHSVKKVWYGYTDEEAVRAAIEGKQGVTKTTTAKKQTGSKPEVTNKYGVKVGDIFKSSWGYEQTNVDFFQVVELVGSCSVRIREVSLPMIEEVGISGMSADRTYKVVHDLLPACPSSVFVKDQERGDIKRMSRENYIKISNYASAYRCTGDTVKCYESWYY